MSDYQTSLLLSKNKIVLNTDLATQIGLNEALVLQQLFYWLEKGIEINGRQWVYKTHAKWQKQDFPFWSVSTIKRTLNNLEKLGLIDVEQLSDNNFDRKNYYTINFKKLKEYEGQTTDNTEKVKLTSSKSQNELDEKVKLNPSDEVKLNPSDEVKLNPSDEVKLNPSDEVKLNPSDEVKLNPSLREQKETKEETTQNVVDVDFDDFYPIAKARLKTSGVIPTFAEYDEDYFKPEIYKFCAWFAERKLNSNQRLYKLTEWFAKFTVEERKQFYITDKPKHSSYQEFEQEAEPEMTLEEQRKALQAVFGGSNEPA